MAEFVSVRLHDAEVVRAIQGLLDAGQRMTPFFKNVGEELVQLAQDVTFPAQRDPVTEAPWVRLSPATLARKRDDRILRESGQLQDTIHYEAYDRSVRVGSVKVYSAVHQMGARTGSFGTVRVNVRKHSRNIKGKMQNVRAHTRMQRMPWGDIPARPYLGIGRLERERILEIAGFYLKKAARK